MEEYQKFLYNKIANWSLSTLDGQHLYFALIKIKVDEKENIEPLLILIKQFISKYEIGEIINIVLDNSFNHEYFIINLSIKFNLNINKGDLYSFFDKEIYSLNEDKKRIKALF